MSADKYPGIFSSQVINNYWTRLSKISLFVSGVLINYLPKPKAISHFPNLLSLKSHFRTTLSRIYPHTSVFSWSHAKKLRFSFPLVNTEWTLRRSVTDWLTDCLTFCKLALSLKWSCICMHVLTDSRLTDWLTDWSTDSLIDRLIHWLTQSLTYSLTDCLCEGNSFNHPLS